MLLFSCEGREMEGRHRAFRVSKLRLFAEESRRFAGPEIPISNTNRGVTRKVAVSEVV